MDIKERLRYFSSKSKKGEGSPLKNKTFSGITIDFSRNFVGSDVFSKMNSINEIIKLEDYKYKYNLLSNSKFRKLFRIIPSLRKLNNIIGMDTVKDQIFKIICYFI